MTPVKSNLISFTKYNRYDFEAEGFPILLEVPRVIPLPISFWKIYRSHSLMENLDQ